MNFLGLKGSFIWALMQMQKGHYLTLKSVTGSVKYRLSIDLQNRIEWDFEVSRKGTGKAEWRNANIFLSDITSTDWIIWKKHEN